MCIKILYLFFDGLILQFFILHGKSPIFIDIFFQLFIFYYIKFLLTIVQFLINLTWFVL